MAVEATAARPAELMLIPWDKLIPDPSQPRKSFPKEEIERLAVSIRKRGILQPLRVRFDPEREIWRLIIGECRWQAAKLAGLTEVPCLPMTAEDVGDDDVLADQIIENGLRNPLAAMDLAHALFRLKQMRKCSNQDIADHTGLCKSAISKSLTLLTLPERIQKMIEAGQIPGETGYLLSLIPDVTTMLEMAEAVAAGTVTRNDVSEAARAARAENRKPKVKPLRLPLDGLLITFPGDQPPSWPKLLATLDRVRKQAKELAAGDKPIAELAEAFKAGDAVSRRNQPDNNGRDDATATAEDGV